MDILVMTPWLFSVPLGVVALAICALQVYLWWYVQCAVDTYAVPPYRALMFPCYSWMRLLLRTLLVVSAAGALWIALLRPVRPVAEPTTRFEYGRDLIIAVDVSRSMLVEDCQKQSRLQAVQDKIGALVGALTSERVALIIFAEAALVLCPLTRDVGAFRMFVEMLDASLLSGSGTTSLAAAIQSAADLVEHGSSRKNALLVIMTDGEDFVGGIEAAQARAAQVGLHISMLGVGSAQGGPIPLVDAEGNRSGHQRDAAGKIVISKLHEEPLRSIAAQCNGWYGVLANDHDRDVADILQWVRAREAEQGAAYETQEYHELFMWGTGWAWCALMGAWMIV